MQPLTGYPVSSLQLNRSCPPMTNGRSRKMRIRLKGINSLTKKLADGTVKTYWYAWKGGPRIDAEAGTPEFIRLYGEAVAGKAKKSTETFISLIPQHFRCHATESRLRLDDDRARALGRKGPWQDRCECL